MGKEDFRTLYKSAFSSGGAIQNDIMPNHLNNILMLLDAIENDSGAIIPLRNKLRTLYIFYKKGLAKHETIEDKFTEINLIIEEWQKDYKNSKPKKLIQLMIALAEDFFYQWNTSGAGIIFTAHDAQQGQKTYNTIIGRTNR